MKNSCIFGHVPKTTLGQLQTLLKKFGSRENISTNIVSNISTNILPIAPHLTKCVSLLVVDCLEQPDELPRPLVNDDDDDDGD